MVVLALLCAAFLLGTLPTGLWVGRLKGVDVRRHGSGNVGATNVVRVVGKLPGTLVLAVDLFKGWLPVVWLGSFGLGWGVGLDPETFRMLLGGAAIAGHIWNPFLKFKGGRGVATALGVLLGLSPVVGLASLGVWLAVAYGTRYVSVASITAAVLAPFWMMFLGAPAVWVIGGIVLGIVIVLRHRENILRLLRGDENRFGKRKDSQQK